MLISLYQAMHYFPLLPDIVAHNFDGAGRPQTWGSKKSFMTIYMVTVTGVAILFYGTTIALSYLPVTRINVPNKEYWLAPERAKKTVAYISSSLLWFGSLSMILLLDIFHQCFRVHIGLSDRLDHMWLSMAGYFLITTIWCIAAISQFSKTKV